MIPRRMDDLGHRRVLVTGATGFIGARLVRALVSAGAWVRAAGRDPARVAGLGAAEVFRCDLTDPGSLAGIEAGIDVAIHCAGALGAWGVGEQEQVRVNVIGTRNLLDRVARAGRVRFLHLSAGGVTGPVGARLADEEQPCFPATVYERTKLAGEREVLARARAGNLPAVVLRPTFTYGPGDRHKLALFRAVQRGRFAFVDEGRSLVHPVFVDDLISGILLSIDRARAGQIYLLGGPRPVTQRELVQTIAGALGVAAPRLSVPGWLARAAAPLFELLGRSLGFAPALTRSRVLMMAGGYGYRIDKAVRELGYQPATQLAEGIALVVGDYRARGLL